MAFLPGWNSPDAVSYWHNAFNIAGIVCLALLVGTETVAQIYGHRETTLSRTAEALRNDAEANRNAEVNGLQKRLSDADKKVSELEAKQPQRGLTEKEKATLIAAISPFGGQKIEIQCIWGDIYGKELATDFVTVAQAAKWDYGGGDGVTQGTFGRDPEGIILLINDAESAAQRAPAGVVALAQALATLHLIPTAGVTGIKNVPVGSVRLLIGKKLPPKAQ